jgi:spore coat protein H
MRAFSRAIVLAGAAFAAAAGAPQAQDAPTTTDLFNPDVVQRIELRMHTADWEKLQENFRSNDYYPADVVWNGLTVRSAGVRSRGLGSRNERKPGLRVDFDRYVSKQTYLGLKSFVLDNLVQDPSTIRETTAMRFFDKMGIPAPREAHARLYVTGRYAGLYAVVESIDKDFLARVLGDVNGDVQNDGYLFEYNFLDRWLFTYLGSSLEPYKQKFDIKTNENKSDETIWRPIEEIVRLANELPSDRYMEQLNPKLDLRQLTRYVAIQTYLGENDGFLGYDGMNNFYFYRKENSEQHMFIAWDEDNSFAYPDFGLQTRHDENVLFRKMMEVRELNDLYYQTIQEAAEAAENRESTALGWLESEVRRQLDLVRESLELDTNKPYSMDDHERERGAMINFASQRSRFVASNLGR